MLIKSYLVRKCLLATLWGWNSQNFWFKVVGPAILAPKFWLWNFGNKIFPLKSRSQYFYPKAYASPKLCELVQFGGADNLADQWPMIREEWSLILAVAAPLPGPDYLRTRSVGALLVRFPNQLAFGSWLGERTPKKQGISTLRVVFSAKNFLVAKAWRNWNKSCVN